MKLSRFAVLYIFIFSLPFAVRFMYALEVFTHDYLGALGVLGTLNHFFAVDILEGNGTPYMLFRPPFYPLILSLLYRFFGISPWIIRNVQWIAGGLCCWLIYWIASYCFNRKTGIVSLIIAGLYVPFIHFESLLTEQSLATFFVTASIACMLPFFIHGKQKKTCFAGAVLFGIGFLIRPDLLTAMPFIIIAFFLVPHETRSKMQVAAYACLILFGMLCLLLNPRFFLPVSGNHVSINASVNFYLGNNLHSDGYTPVFHDIPHIRSDHPDARKHHMTEITLAGIMHAKSNQVETLEKIPAFWMHKTIQSIISNPTHFITVLFKKFMLFFNGFIITNQRDIYFIREYSRILHLLLWNRIICFPLGLIIPFFILGIFAHRTSNRAALLLLAVPAGCMLTTLLFFHAHRFLIPAIPFFLVFAGNGILFMWNYFKQKHFRITVKPLIIFLLLLLLSNHNLFRTHTVRWAQENFNAGSFYFSRQNYDAAKQYFEKSLSYDESYTPALLNLASTYIQTQRYEEGLTDFLQMYRASKTAQWPIPYGITQLLFASGNLEEAERWGIKICQNYPDQPECYNLLGSIYFSQSDFPHAEEILRKGISRFPHASQLFSNLGSVLLREKKYPEAIQVLTDALAKTTSYPEPFYLLGTAYYESGDYASAQKIMEQAAASFDGYPDMWFLLTQVYIRTNQHARADIACNYLYKLTSPDKAVVLQLAQRFSYLKQYKYAQLFAEQAVNLGIPETEIEHLLPSTSNTDR